MQDNGSWRGPSTVWVNGGIRNFHWRELCYGDGFDTVPDPEDSMRGYAMSQEGYLYRWNLRTGELKDIRPEPVKQGELLRFNWNAGIAVDPFDAGTLYYGSQYVHKSIDRGETWTVISGDLTTNRPEWQKQDESGGITLDVTGAENFTSVTVIAPSPLQEGVLWAGTDDGRLHVTRDGGATWTSVEKHLPGVPENTWIPHIAPSRFEAGSAFVVCDDHRRSNWTPYVLKTADFGATWTSLATDEIWGYALVIEQDPMQPDLLYLGTEFGLYLSLNGGKTWFKWTHGVPTVSVMDLVVHPREHDLVLGTHGRSAYVLDDVRPLREITEAVTARKMHLFQAPPAQQYRRSRAPSTRNAGTNEYRGESRAYGALLTFWMNFDGLPHPDEERERARSEAERKIKAESETKADDAGEEDGKPEEGPQVTVEILNPDGEVIRTFERDVHLGVNRVAWDLRMDPFEEARRPDRDYDDERGGPEVLPGPYTVRMKYEDQEVRGEVQVLPDPRREPDEQARRANFEAVLRAGRMQETAARAIERLARTRIDLDRVMTRMKGDEKKKKDKAGVKRTDEEREAHEALVDSGKTLGKKLKEVENLFWTAEPGQAIGPGRHVLRKVGYIMRSLGSTWDTPTPAQLAYLEEADAALREALAELNRFFEEEVAAFQRQTEAAGIRLFKIEDPLRIE
jgi:hypothetical protein